MSAYEVMLSESQERMVVIPKREHLDDVVALFRRWELHADVIGVVTDDQRVTVRDGDQVVASMPIGILTDPPQYEPPQARPADLDRRQAEDLSALPDLEDANAALLELLGSENIASRRWIYRQYDHQVLTNTIVPPRRRRGAAVAERHAAGHRGRDRLQRAAGRPRAPDRRADHRRRGRPQRRRGGRDDRSPSPTV